MVKNNDMFNNFSTNVGIELANSISVPPEHNSKDYLQREPSHRLLMYCILLV